MLNTLIAASQELLISTNLSVAKEIIPLFKTSQAQFKETSLNHQYK